MPSVSTWPIKNRCWTTGEISVFITPRALITVRKSAFDIDTLIGRWDLDGELASSGGVSFLVYGLLDAVVDGHYEAVRELEDAVDVLEDQLFKTRPGVDIRREGFQLRKVLADCGGWWPPCTNWWEGSCGPTFTCSTNPSSSTTTTCTTTCCASPKPSTARDRVGSILDTNLNEQGHQLNEITKKLAAWAAIIAVRTAVTGFYGQNVPYPGFGHWSGFIASAFIILNSPGPVRRAQT